MKSYLITDPQVYGSDPEGFLHTLENALVSHPIDYAVLRDKENPLYAKRAPSFIDLCRKHGVQTVLLHGDAALAHDLAADGVHLTSSQFDSIAGAKSMGLFVIVSTHTHAEAAKAEALGADAITYSPIFASPNKGEPKGLEDLKEIVDKINIPIFALGGIVSAEQIDAVEKCGAYGFASIRYFISAE